MDLQLSVVSLIFFFFFFTKKQICPSPSSKSSFFPSLFCRAAALTSPELGCCSLEHSARVKGSFFINMFVGKTPRKRLSLQIARVPARAGCGLTKLGMFALFLRGLLKQNLSPHQFPWEEGGTDKPSFFGRSRQLECSGR